MIGVFDRTGRNKGQLTFEVDSNVHYTFQQVNKVQAHSDFQIIMTAHENKYLRFFDLKSSKRGGEIRCADQRNHRSH